MSVKTAVEDSMPPEIPTRSQFSEITIDIIKNISREFNLSNITYLNLFNNNLKKSFVIIYNDCGSIVNKIIRNHSSKLI